PADRQCRTLFVRRGAQRADQPPPPAKGARDHAARRAGRGHRNRRAAIARTHRDRATGVSPRARGDPESATPRARGLSISSVRKSDLSGHRPADGHFQGGGQGTDAPRPRPHRRRDGARPVSGNDAFTRAALRAEATQWFNLERSGDMTVDDELRFLDWLDQSDAHRDAYRLVERAWLIAGTIPQEPEMLSPADLDGERESRRPGWRRHLALAASLLL